MEFALRFVLMHWSGASRARTHSFLEGKGRRLRDTFVILVFNNVLKMNRADVEYGVEVETG